MSRRRYDGCRRDNSSLARTHHRQLSGPSSLIAACNEESQDSRKNYAGTAPITRASGKEKVVLSRYARNRRLEGCTAAWAFGHGLSAVGKPRREGVAWYIPVSDERDEFSKNEVETCL